MLQNPRVWAVLRPTSAFLICNNTIDFVDFTIFF